MLSIAKPIKIKVLLRQFSLLMLIYVIYSFLCCYQTAALLAFGKCRTIITPRGSKGAERENKTKKNNNNNNKKQDAMGAFFPACFLPCTSRSPGRYSRRLACLHSHVLRAYCNIDAQFYSNFAFELNVNTLKLFLRYVNDVPTSKLFEQKNYQVWPTVLPPKHLFQLKF